MGKITDVLSSLQRSLGRDGLERNQDETARSLLQLFTSFIMKDGVAEPRELEIAFDFARNLFPDIDHGRLGKHLEETIARPIDPKTALTNLRKNLSTEQKTALGLQLYSVIQAGGNLAGERSRFVETLERIGEKEIGEAIVTELSQPNAPKTKPLIRIDFSTSSSSDVRLKDLPNQSNFRCYRAGGMILLRNMAEDPMWVRGHTLETDQLIQIRPNDEVVTLAWRLSYDELAFFLANEEHPPPLYLVEEAGELTMGRAKSKSAIAKIIFRHQVSLEPLQENKLRGKDDEPLKAFEIYKLHYHDKVRVDRNQAIPLDAIRRLSLQTGQRFTLPAGRRKVLVSNDPSLLSGDSFLLTPGLAGRFVLELDFDPGAGQGEITVLESTQAILADDQAIEKASLQDGAVIRLSSRQALRCRFSDNILDEERNLVRHLQVEGLNHSFWKGGKTIDSLSFQVNRGQMLCIIGPSGSGKSTLLEILAGQRKPQSGHVRLNGLSLYERQRRLSPLISFMPQEDALSAQLSSREHLSHACAIRRPHLAHETVQRRVSHLLSDLGLDRIAERRVGSADSKSLSGGERSRLNAGLDLIGGGEVFLFDEPISGLSSKDAEHVVHALHRLARDKIVVASLHRPSPKVLESFDLVLLLDSGGKMAFYGSPREMVDYFEKAREELKAFQYQPSGHSSADFVFDVLEAPLLNLQTGTRTERRFPPDFWQERFENRRVIDHLSIADHDERQTGITLATAADHVRAPEPPVHGRRQQWTIFKTHLARALKSKFRHRGTFYSILLEAPLLALLIAYTLRASPEGSYQFHSALHMPSYLFLSITIAMFFGLTNSATEVLRDRPLLRRERNCRPHPLLYLGAKFLVLTILVILQSLTFALAAHSMLEIKQMLVPHLAWMTLTGCCGTALALFISVVARSERSALGAIPLILVPQILLAGALIPFVEMNRGLFHSGDEGRSWGSEPVPSTIMPLRYAYEGSVISQATENLFELERRPTQARIDELKELKTLTDAEDEELQSLSEKIRILYAATSTNLKDAVRIIRDPASEKDRLMRLTEIEEEAIPVSQFFVNQRIENMVELAETSRLDDRRTETAHVFLAEEKSFLGYSMSTLWYCRFFLLTISLVFMILATGFLKLSLHKA
ncbi:ATP-binding cassette domain-containing protein [bacterium]|nr:ATP-binding cassette domain-containing protein [bacterium]